MRLRGAHEVAFDNLLYRSLRVERRVQAFDWRGIHKRLFVHLGLPYGEGSKVMKKVFVIFVAISWSTSVMAAASSRPPANSAGTNTYKTACVSCHGADGR